MKLLFLSLIVAVCTARYIGVSHDNALLDVNIETGSYKKIGEIKPDSKQNTTITMIYTATHYSEEQDTFFAFFKYESEITQQSMVKYDRKTGKKYQGPYFYNYRPVIGIYTVGKRLFAVDDNLGITEYDWETLDVINTIYIARVDRGVLPSISINEKQKYVTVRIDSGNSFVQILTFDANKFDNPTQMIVHRAFVSFNLGNIYSNPIFTDRLVTRFALTDKSPTQLLDIETEHGIVYRNITVQPVSDYRGTVDDSDVSVVNGDEFITGFLENSAAVRQFIVVFDLKNWKVKRITRSETRWYQFKLFVVND